MVRTWVEVTDLGPTIPCPLCGQWVAWAKIGHTMLLVEDHPDVEPMPPDRPARRHACPGPAGSRGPHAAAGAGSN